MITHCTVIYLMWSSIAIKIILDLFILHGRNLRLRERKRFIRVTQLVQVWGGDKSPDF